MAEQLVVRKGQRRVDSMDDRMVGYWEHLRVEQLDSGSVVKWAVD